jgi:MYXO-CTERM domain-containing protein
VASATSPPQAGRDDRKGLRFGAGRHEGGIDRERDIVVNNLKMRSVAVAAVSVASFAVSANAQSSGGSIRLSTGSESVTWTVGVDGTTEWSDSGYDFSGNDFGSGWGINWDMLSTTATAQSILGNITVINTSSETQTFFLFVSDAVATEYMAGSLVGGSVAGTFTDLNGNGVTVTAVDGGSIYSAFVDATELDPFNGTVVGNLLDGASGSAGTFLSGTFGESAFGDAPILPSEAIGGASINFGFMIEFTLSAGDTAGFTGSMAIATPAPGALAIFGLGGLARRRRRG